MARSTVGKSESRKQLILPKPEQAVRNANLQFGLACTATTVVYRHSAVRQKLRENTVLP